MKGLSMHLRIALILVLVAIAVILIGFSWGLVLALYYAAFMVTIIGFILWRGWRKRRAAFKRVPVSGAAHPVVSLLRSMSVLSPKRIRFGLLAESLLFGTVAGWLGLMAALGLVAGGLMTDVTGPLRYPVGTEGVLAWLVSSSACTLLFYHWLLSAENSDHPSRFSRRFLEHQLEVALSNSAAFCHSIGVNPDYSLSSLVSYEVQLPKGPEEYARFVSNVKGYEDSSLGDWLVALPPGSYLGEIMVKHLGGKWRYPSRLRVLIGIYCGYLSPVFDHWFVTVGEQKVPVFEIAKRSMMLGVREESLSQVYNGVKRGTYRRRKGP